MSKKIVLKQKKINMNAKNLIYILSLIIIAVSIFLIIEYSNSNRISLVAGITTMIGFCLNIAGFLMPNKKFTLSK